MDDEWCREDDEDPNQPIVLMLVRLIVLSGGVWVFFGGGSAGQMGWFWIEARVVLFVLVVRMERAFESCVGRARTEAGKVLLRKSGN